MHITYQAEHELSDAAAQAATKSIKADASACYAAFTDPGQSSA